MLLPGLHILLLYNQQYQEYWLFFPRPSTVVKHYCNGIKRTICLLVWFLFVWFTLMYSFRDFFFFPVSIEVLSIRILLLYTSCTINSILSCRIAHAISGKINTKFSITDRCLDSCTGCL